MSSSSFLDSVPAKFCHEGQSTGVLISLRDTMYYSHRIDYLFGLTICLVWMEVREESHAVGEYSKMGSQ